MGSGEVGPGLPFYAKWKSSGVLPTMGHVGKWVRLRILDQADQPVGVDGMEGNGSIVF